MNDGASYVPRLLDRGFAVLRYDKRGVGLSTGVYRGVSPLNSEAQVAELALDMTAALGFLTTRPQIDRARVGLMGTSQAGWVMVAAAALSPLPRFAIAVTGSVVPVGVNVRYEGLGTIPIDEAYALLETYDGPRGFDPEPTLRTLSIPTLWLLAEQDRLVPTRVCRRALQRLRAEGARTEFAVYAEGGHSLPAVDFWPAIDDFLSGPAHTRAR